MTSFDEAYYTTQNYSSYLERQERYTKMMQELHHDLFRRVCLDFTNEYVLDYGCAVGFVVNALRNLGYKNVHGYDISEWAVNWGTTKFGLKTLHNNVDDLICQPKLMLALDVLEHMDIEQIKNALNRLKPNYLLTRIPLAKTDNQRYVLDVSENDPTHKLRLTRETWKTMFKNMRYDWLFDINTGLIYDTPGVMCSIFRSEQ